MRSLLGVEGANLVGVVDFSGGTLEARGVLMLDKALVVLQL